MKHKNIKIIRGGLSDKSISRVISILEFRPTIWNMAMKKYNGKIEEQHRTHFIYFNGFYEGYQYAIRRLKKQIK